jgi:HSP90 family molecular chaperone
VRPRSHALPTLCARAPPTLLVARALLSLRRLSSLHAQALDKIRHRSLTDKALLETNPELYIHIIPDKSNNSLTLIDSGIGMTKTDLIACLGTIAQSGTKVRARPRPRAHPRLCGTHT